MTKDSLGYSEEENAPKNMENEDYFPITYIPILQCWVKG